MSRVCKSISNNYLSRTVVLVLEDEVVIKVKMASQQTVPSGKTKGKTATTSLENMVIKDMDSDKDFGEQELINSSGYVSKK